MKNFTKTICLSAILMFVLANVGWGQTTIINENIQSWTNQVSYGSYTQIITVGVGTGTVTMTQCLVSNAASGTGTCTIGRVQMQGANGILEIPEITSVSTVEFHLAAGSTGRSVKLQKYNGSTWDDITTFTGINTTGATYTYTINQSSNIILRLASPSHALYVHDIIIKDYVSTPTITVSTSSLNSFGNVVSGSSSSEQNYTVSGSNLTANISISAPTGFEISTTSGSGFGSSLILTQSGGTVSETTIYARFSPIANQSYSGDISHTSTGATTKNVSVSGTGIVPYRSKASGDWGSASTWQISTNGGSNWIDASQSPSSSDYTISIQNGHVVTIASSLSSDELTIETGGQISISSDYTFTIENGSGTDLIINGTLLNSGTLLIDGSSWSVNSGGTYIHNTTSSISTPLSAVSLDASSNFIYRNSGTAVSISGRTYGNLSFESSSGNWSPSPSGSGALTINGNLSIGTSGDGTVSLSTKGYTGTITISGSMSVGSGSIYTLGASQLTYGSLTNNGTFNLELDNASGLTLAQSLVLNGTLTLTNGLLTLGDYNLTLGESSTISGTPSASNMVVATGTGELRKTFTGTGSFTFPVGDNSGTAEYSPVTLDFTSGTFTSAYAGVNLKNEKYSNNSSNTDYLDRYWTITQSGITSFSCGVSLYYVDADVHGTEANIFCGSYNGSSWSLLNVSDPDNNELSGTVTSFSTFTGGESGVLPAELTSFTSSASANSVLLTWSTAVEQNNSGFDIERKKTESSDWQKVGFVQGHGTTNTPQSYSYSDKFLSTGKYNYRLKQIDYNGNYHYYTLGSEVTIGVPKKFEVSQNFPNPFNPVTKINYELPNDSKVSIKVFDMLGREVATLLDEFKTAGYHTVDFDGSSLSSGMYFYRIKTNEFEAIRKMLLLK